MKLKEYLNSNGIKISFFAKKLGVTPTSLFKYFRGHKPSKFIAKDIEELTGGKVTAKEMLDVEPLNDL